MFSARFHPHRASLGRPTWPAVVGSVAGLVICGSALAQETDPWKLPIQTIEIRASPYNVSSESTATKSDSPTWASPFGVDVVPRHLFDDKGALDMEEVLRNVGAHGVDASGWGAKSFFLRGFQVDNYYVDGVKQASFTQIDPALIQQIDVLRGAAGSLYGRIEPGGVINVATVSPASTPSIFAEQTFGGYELWRTVFDATGPLSKDSPLLYRLTAAYQTNASFRDYVHNTHVTIAPSLAWIGSPADRVDLKLLYQDFADTNDSGLPLVPVSIDSAGVTTRWRFLNAPDSFHVGPLDSGYHGRTTSVTLSATHEFDANWSLKPTVGWYRLNQPGTEGGFTDWANQPPNGWGPVNPTLANIYVGNPSNFYQDQRFAELDLNGKFSTFGIAHSLLLSAEYFKHFYSYQVWTSTISPNPIDITRPVYQSVDAFQSNPDPSQIAFGDVTKDRWTSYTLQDQLSIGTRLRVLLGLRQDRSTTSLASPTGDCAGWYCDYKDSRLTPRAGISYDISASLVAYGSYSQGYGINDFWQLYDGSLSKSQTSRQSELGLKGHWFGDRLVARATVFDLKKRNIVVSLPIQDFPGGSCVAPDFTGNACFAQVGTFGSRGAELQLEGRLSDSLNVNIYYEVVDAKVLDGGDSIGTVSYPVGNHLADVASRSGSLWVQYSARSGWGIGAGADGMSSRPFNGMNNFTLPGYLQFDAAATYQWKAGPAELRAQINVKNLTGVRTAYDLNWDGTSVLPSAPCTVMASLSARWR